MRDQRSIARGKPIYQKRPSRTPPMPSSLQLTALQPLTVEQKAKENLSHLFVARLGAELGDSQGICDFSKAAKLVVVRNLKSYFHLMHRRHAGSTKPPAPMQDKTLERHFYVVVRRPFSEGVICKISRLIHQCICDVLVHMASVAELGRHFHSYSPREL